VISLKQVSKRYPGNLEALRDLNLDISTGEAVLLTGRSGAGKTTLLKLVSAIEMPSAGEIMVNGQSITRLRRSQIPYLRRSIGIVFQDQKLLFDSDVLTNVTLPLHICGQSRSVAMKRARAALDRVGLLERERSLPVALSGGERQRLCIARAIVNRPSLLLVDEPTANLDPDYAKAIIDLFRSFHQAGVTVVIATHDIEVINRFPLRQIHLDQGRLLNHTGPTTY